MVQVCSAIDERFECVCGGGARPYLGEECFLRNQTLLARCTLCDLQWWVFIMLYLGPGNGSAHIERQCCSSACSWYPSKCNGGENGLAHLGTKLKLKTKLPWHQNINLSLWSYLFAFLSFWGRFWVARAAKNGSALQMNPNLNLVGKNDFKGIVRTTQPQSQHDLSTNATNTCSKYTAAM